VGPTHTLGGVTVGSVVTTHLGFGDVTTLFQDTRFLGLLRNRDTITTSRRGFADWNRALEGSVRPLVEGGSLGSSFFAIARRVLGIKVSVRIIIILILIHHAHGLLLCLLSPRHSRRGGVRLRVVPFGSVFSIATGKSTKSPIVEAVIVLTNVGGKRLKKIIIPLRGVIIIVVVKVPRVATVVFLGSGEGWRTRR